MEGIVFYDESNGVVPLKSTITNRGNVKLRRLDDGTIGALRVISQLDPTGSNYPTHDEAKMRVIDSMCKADVGRVPGEDFLCWYRDYKSFAALATAKWTALRDGNVTTERTECTGRAWRPAPRRAEPQPEYFNCEGKGFFLLPVEALVPCLEQLCSMVRLWDAVHNAEHSAAHNTPSGFHTVMNTKHIKIFDDTKHGLLHILYPLHRDGDVILTRLKGKKVQTFELIVENDSFFVISIETPTENTTITFMNFLEWGIDKAYDMLFGEKKRKAASTITVNLKIKK